MNPLMVMGQEERELVQAIWAQGNQILKAIQAIH